MRTISQAVLSVVLAAIPAIAESHLTQADLLRRMIDLERLTLPPVAGERTLTFGPEDRLPGDDGWDRLAQVSGPGMVTYLWFREAQGDLRLVLDGEVVWQGALAELLAGKVTPLTEPFVFGGHTCCFPIAFNESCRLEGRGVPNDYLVACWLFAHGTRVARFDRHLDEGAQQACAEVRRALNEGLSDKQIFGERRMMPVAVAEEIGPGEVLSQALEQAGTVRALYIALTDRSDPRDLYALHRLVLRVYVDGQQSPNVAAPLIDFFASGFDKVPLRSLVAGTDRELSVPLPGRPLGQDRYMYCLWPMPYSDGLRVEIENRNEGRRKIGLLLLMQVDRRSPPANSLRFFARFRRCDPCRTDPYAILDTGGPGRLVGLLLNVDCPRPQWWGGGALRVWVDGGGPLALARGVDSYFGQAGALHVEHSALLGVTRAGPYGKNSAYRWHLADDICFQKTLRVALDNTQADAQDTYFASVAFWYACGGSEHKFAALQEADLVVPGLRIPGAVEIEGQILGTDWGNVMKEKHAGGVELSGRQAANVSTDQQVRIVLPAERTERATLKLRVHPQRAFERISVADEQGAIIGTVVYDGRPDGIYPVGCMQLKHGDNLLLVRCTPRAVLDCWIIEPATSPDD